MTTLSPHKPSLGIAAIRRLMPLATAAAMLTAAVSSCDSVIYDNPDDPSPVGPQELTATLQFQVSSNAPISSRALNEAENDAGAGTADENYVDLQTLSFILADGDGKAIMPFYPSVTPDAASDYKTYTVISELPQAALNKTSSADNQNANFQILVIANARTNGVERMPYGFSLESYDPNNPVKLSSFFGAENSPTFQFPLAGNTTDAGWSPSIADAHYIPMAGVQNFSVPVAKLEESTPEQPANLETVSTTGKVINLLRAVARVDVKLSAASAAAGISITGVTLTGYNTRGALLPAASAWLPGEGNTTLYETQYILDTETPTIPSNNGYANTSTLPLVYNATDKVWSIYLPEYDWTQTPTPEFSVKFAQTQGGVTTELPDESTFTLSKYGTDGKPVAPINLIRNNLYTYELTKTTTTSEDASISIKYTVCTMTPITVDIPEFE